MSSDNKYIVIQVDIGNDLLREDIFIFSNMIDHSHIVNYLHDMYAESYDQKIKIVSAGFVSHAFICYGESVSLRLKSRGKDDKKLILQPNPNLHIFSKPEGWPYGN